MKQKESSEFCRIGEVRDHPLSYTHTMPYQDISEKQPSQGAPRTQPLRKPAWKLWLLTQADVFSVGKPSKLPLFQGAGIEAGKAFSRHKCCSTQVVLDSQKPGVVHHSKNRVGSWD